MNKLSKSLCAMILAGLLGSLVKADAQGTAFTYQGKLNEAGSPPSGSFDMTFSLYTAPSGGSSSFVLTNLGIGVSNGLFAATLDFGSGVFDGQTWWLELGVRTNGSETYSILSPRVQVLPAPYAIYAATAGQAAGTASFSGSLNGDVSGTQSATVVSTVGGQSAANVASGAVAANGAASANTASAIVKRDASGNFAAGTITAGNFIGGGAGLTNVPASSITGTLPDAQITNVFFLNASNNFANILVATNTANQIGGTFTGALNGNATSATTATTAATATTATTAGNFSGSLSGDVTGTQGATVVSTVGGQSAANVASGAVAANGAASANTPSTIVKRDASGNFSAGTISASFSGNGGGLTNVPASSITGTINDAQITNVFFLNASNNVANVLVATNTANQIGGTFTGPLNGNATSATTAATAATATTAENFSGSLSGDVTGTQSATVVSSVGGQSAANVASAAAAANGAASANTPSTIVQRDASGNFSAGTISASFSGNGGGLTNLPAASITGALGAGQLVNVAFLNASNNFSNVIVATNSANEFVGNFTGILDGIASTATGFAGHLFGDVTGVQGGTVVSFVGGQSANNVASATFAANNATSANTPNSIVFRDGSGGFSAGTVTAGGFTGNGSGLTNIPASSITGALNDSSITNVFFLGASNDLVNVVVATNSANEIGGSFNGNAAGLTNYQGSNVVNAGVLNAFTYSSTTNVSIPFSQGGAIYQTVANNLCFSNITGLGAGYNTMTIYLQASSTFTASWLPHVNLVGAFTTNGLQLTNSQGWYVMALTCLGTNWQANTCTYAICPPNQ